LVIRGTAYDYGTVDAEFDIDGAKGQIENVEKACGTTSPL
jgi:hypothetical protein